MIILLGSTNPVKVAATRLAASQYSQYASSEVIACSVASNVADQPKTMEETFQGAINRAKSAFQFKDKHSVNDVLGIGIEGGLAVFSHSNTGYMNICAACIFDGENTFFGLSSGFEHPPAVLVQVFENNQEISNAYKQAGLFVEKGYSATDLKHGEGAVGLMTLGRLNRTDYCAQALLPAFGALIQKNLFI